MKRSYLEGLDIGGGAHLSKDAIDAIMTEHGKTVTQHKAELDTLNAQLAEANQKLTGYDPQWKDKADAAARQLEAQQFDFAIERALTAAKPKNAKAVAALLDREKLKFAGGEVIGLDQQIKALKEDADTAFLFETDKPKKTGMSHQNSAEGGTGKYDAANEAIRTALRRG